MGTPSEFIALRYLYGSYGKIEENNKSKWKKKKNKYGIV